MGNILTIIIGVVFIVGGLSGQLTLRFTDSAAGIIIVGSLLVGWGVFRLVQDRKKK